MNIKLTDEQKIRIMRSKDVWRVMRQVLLADEKVDRDKEHFWVMGLMSDNLIHYIELVSLGTLNSALIHPREVFRVAVIKGTASMILAHNHPSGNLIPSPEDIDVTKQLVQVGLLHGIPVQDHIIITSRSYFSMRAEKMWEEIENDTKYKPKYLIEYERTITMVREMKNEGIEVSRIVKISGLTAEEIERL